MDFDRVNNQSEILKKFHLMEPDREVISSYANCNVSAHFYTEKISFDPTLLDHFNEDTILWLLLHEEGHLALIQEAQKRQNSIMKIWLAAIIISGISLCFLSSVWGITFSFFVIALIADFGFISLLIFYIDRRIFYQHYYVDEYRSDENAVKGLFIIRPDIISWQVMYSSFPAFKECSKITKRSFFRKLYLRIITKPHPPNILRVQRMRIIYNMYKHNKIPNC